jgi:DNA mismatch repair ATPase MutS
VLFTTRRRPSQSLDYESVRNLELLAPLAEPVVLAGAAGGKGGRSGGGGGVGDGTLFGALNHTKTSVGAKLLRAQVRVSEVGTSLR